MTASRRRSHYDLQSAGLLGLRFGAHDDEGGEEDTDEVFTDSHDEASASHTEEAQGERPPRTRKLSEKELTVLDEQEAMEDAALTSTRPT